MGLERHDAQVNVAKKKALNNIRSANKEIATGLNEPKVNRQPPNRHLLGPCDCAGFASLHNRALCELLTSSVPDQIMLLDDALEYIVNDELVEVTPVNVRIRKQPQRQSR